jgi:CheY-like chemotaxis protein
LRIESTPGRGTTVLLSLPLASVPLWFVPELTIERGSRIVVIDDDTSIHQVWMQRFSADLLQKYQLKLIHFSAPEQLVQLQASNHPTLYLCDYEFAQHQENGIDLIMQLNILKKSILVTSRFEEGLLLERCLSIGLKVLPKGMTGFVPIRFDGGLEH